MNVVVDTLRLKHKADVVDFAVTSLSAQLLIILLV